MLYTSSPQNQIHHHSCFLTHPIKLHYRNPSHHLQFNHSNKRIPPSNSTTDIFYSLSAIDKHQENQDQIDNYNVHYTNYNGNYKPSVYLNNTRRKKGIQEVVIDVDKGDSSRGILSNMLWADLKAAVGQRINVEGLLFSVSVITKNKNWVIPHVTVPDIRYIDWAALKRKGFEGVVFDKDNTLTVPYSLALWGPISESVDSCKAVFGNNISVFSNSAGLQEYDPDGRKARALEFVIGIRVIRHKTKKPAGSAEEIEKHFGCDSSKLIMVGDRPFTDIVYGNRNGFLTILTAPLSLTEEPFIVKQVRKIEVALVNWWLKKGLKPANQRLLSDPLDCVTELPLL